MKFSYMPGCSLKTGGVEYDMALQAVAKRLNMDLVEVDDWNCCGATPVSSSGKVLSLVLSARNLALSQTKGRDMIVPCNGCYSKLARAAKVLDGSADSMFTGKVLDLLEKAGFSHPGVVRVRHPIEVVLNEVGLKVVESEVINPLSELKVVLYYGCLFSRPGDITGVSKGLYPTGMDEIIASLGGEALPFRQKTKCCGGALLLPRPEVTMELTKRLLEEAAALGADCIVTPCPLCSITLDGKQWDIRKRYATDFDIPVLYFPQLMGLAFGINPRELGLNKNFVSTKRLLGKWCR